MLRRLALSLFLIVTFLALGPGAGIAAPREQTEDPATDAQALLDTLSPEERIGQLFLVDFQGTAIDDTAHIHDLVVNRHIGGVILWADNDNIVGPDGTLISLQKLNIDLQELRFLATQFSQINPATQETFFPQYTPLFIGMSQSGDGAPLDQVHTGMTVLPSAMAIGATWDTDLAVQAGTIMGQELSALGINLFLGPSLDVLENPNAESGADLGVQTFGGDPFWVGQMGSAFISGVHDGGGGRVLVVSEHFPGHGGSDRLPGEEVATIRKSLEQLKQIELAPFFAVTGEANTPESISDALLISHIRYQGLQGNIRVSTRPVSFDETAFAEIMSLPQFGVWRQNGGVIITDNLSSRAVRRFYDPSDINFNARLVARDAFLAGSDILYLGNITSTGDEDSYTTVVSILDFFAQKYREDVAFAQRVDESVLRILTLKFRIYGRLSLDQVVLDRTELNNIGLGEDLTFEVARSGVTLISPRLADLDFVLPDVPGLNDRIVFIGHTQISQQCSTCEPSSTFSSESMEQAVLRLYGLEAGNQVAQQNLTSLSFTDLLTLLDGESGSGLIESSIRSADWIVIGLVDVAGDLPEANALQRLLAEREDLIRQKRVILFAFGAPYYLDATEISKLTAYYGLYGKTPIFAETAARILFKELTPSTGALPVSVPGIGYDLISATSPDPLQQIVVMIDAPAAEAEEILATPTVTPIPQLESGDTLALRTSIIVDHNGNPVPDNTPVQFIFNLAGEESFSAPVFTVSGVASLTFEVNGAGPLEIRALSGQATESIPLRVDLPSPDSEGVPEATQAAPTAVVALPSEPATATPEAAEDTAPPEVEARVVTDLIDWLLGVISAFFAGFLVYRIGSVGGQIRWSIRQGALTMIGGLTTYCYLAIGLTGSAGIIASGGRIGVLVFVMAGAVLGWGGAFFWRLISGSNSVEPPMGPERPAKTKSG